MTTKIVKGEEGQQQQQQQQQGNINININVHVVVSYCNAPIDWIWKHYLKNQNQSYINI
jgi:hypothetical protein